MEILIYIGVIIGFYIIAYVIAFVQSILENSRLKKLLRHNKDSLNDIDFIKISENIKIYKELVNKNNTPNLLLPKSKIDNEKFTKRSFLSSLYKKYKYKNEALKDVLFRG